MSYQTEAIKNLATIETGKTPSTKDDSNFGGKIPFVTPAELDFADDIHSTPRTLTEKGASGLKLVPKNSILICCIGSLGKVGVAGRTLATNQQINSVTFDDEKVWPRFGFYALRLLKPQMESLAPATTVKIISKSKFSELRIPLPPLDEQKRIAGILDQSAEICRLRQLAIDKLNTLGHAIFHEMFAGEKERHTAPLEELIDVRSSLGDPTLPEFKDLPHVSPEHIERAGAEIKWDRVQSCADDGVTSGKYRFEPGDIIYSKIRPYLNKVAIADRGGMCSADMYAITICADRLRRRYLHFALGSVDFLSYAQKVSGRANIPKMNRKQLLRYHIPVPDIGKQEEFEAKLDLLLEERNLHVSFLEQAENMFASLQHRAFNGEL